MRRSQGARREEGWCEHFREVHDMEVKEDEELGEGKEAEKPMRGILKGLVNQGRGKVTMAANGAAGNESNKEGQAGEEKEEKRRKVKAKRMSIATVRPSNVCSEPVYIRMISFKCMIYYDFD